MKRFILLTCITATSVLAQTGSGGRATGTPFGHAGELAVVASAFGASHISGAGTSREPDVEPEAAAPLLADALSASEQQPSGGDERPPLRGVISFYLRLNSLQPSKLTITEGRYIVRVNNDLVLGSVTVQIEDGSRSRVAEKQMSREAPRFKDVIDLKPGEYTVRVTGKPSWSSSLKVVAKKGA